MPPTSAPPTHQLRSLTVDSFTTTLPVHYTITLRLSVQTWSLHRRYSAFLNLDSEITAQAGAPPASLPAKQRGASYIVQRILPASASSSSSSATNEEYLEQRRVALERYLNAIWRASDARWRECRAFKMFLEWPVEVPLLPPPAASTAAAAAPAAAATQPPRQPTLSAGPAYTAARSLGAPSNPPNTTPSSSSTTTTDLYASQQSEMDRQDQHLTSLAAILRRQRDMGNTINDELVQQTELLRNLDDEVEATQAKMQQADAKMQKVEGSRGKRMFGLA